MDDDENNTRYLTAAKIMREEKEAKIKSLSKFSMHELVEEMCKREGVRSLISTEHHWYKVCIQHEDDFHSINGDGSATILVIKK